jgi:hypothetical protein
LIRWCDDIGDGVELVLQFRVFVLQISVSASSSTLLLVLAMIAFLLFDGFVSWILCLWA